LTSALDGGWVVSVTPQPRFTPGKRIPGINWIGGWVGIRAGMETKAIGKLICLCGGSKPDSPVCSQTLHWLSYPSSSTPPHTFI
jgi:hypothetical protein